MSENKKMRFEETRNMATRHSQSYYDSLRKEESMFFRDSLAIDPSIVPPGWEYGWARQAYFKTGEYEDANNVAEMMKKGWSPVPADRHPELRPIDFLGRNADLNGYIYRNGSLLMEIPKDIFKQNLMKAQQLAKRQNETVIHNQLRSPHMRLHVVENTTIGI